MFEVRSLCCYRFGQHGRKRCGTGELIILIPQSQADIWRHLGCLGELVQIDRQNALKFTPSHFTSPGDSSHSEAEVELAGETQLSDGEPLAVQTYGLAVTTVMNISLLSEVGRHILFAADKHTHFYTLLHTHTVGFTIICVSFEAAFSHVATWPFTEDTDLLSGHTHRQARSHLKSPTF